MRLRELAERINAQLAPESQDLDITGLASLADANTGDLSFYGNPKYLMALRKCRASVVLVPTSFNEPVGPLCLGVDHPAEAFAALLPLFTRPPISHAPGIHPTALIDPTAILGESCSIGAYVVIQKNARLGADASSKQAALSAKNLRLVTTAISTPTSPYASVARWATE